MNHLLKRFFLTRTQRGGRSGRGATRSSRVRSVGKWMQRRLMWLTLNVRPEDVPRTGWKRMPILKKATCRDA